ncbi:hypothetical protein ATANTOWER_003146, partial [Ataeniobius toweri]|nr:hypothetical protein [Ataeniobius toweri]
KRTLLTLHQLLTQNLSRVLTIFLDKLTVSAAASIQSSQAPHHSSTPTTFHQTCCASSPGSSSIATTCQNKLVKLFFSCLLSVILHVGQISKENDVRVNKPAVSF